MIASSEWPYWQQQFEQFLRDQHNPSDVAHDFTHITRVVSNATTLAKAEAADLAVVLPAAWLHDCVLIPKNSPLRSKASALAAEAAADFLQRAGYPTHYLTAIRHAIEAHSFSANLPPRTLEAKVVQDADRLDAIGAIGIARCLMLGGAMGQRLYDPEAPFPDERQADDRINSLDHFYCKLLRLAERMQTNAGRAEAIRRTDFMRAFLTQLRGELAQ